MISFIYARSSLLAATGKRACIITANKLSPIELSHLIWTHLHMIVFVYVRSGWRKKNKKNWSFDWQIAGIIEFCCRPSPPSLPPRAAWEIKRLLAVSSGRNSTWWSDPESNTAVRRQQTSFFDMQCVWVYECVCVWRLSHGLLVWCNKKQSAARGKWLGWRWWQALSWTVNDSRQIGSSQPLSLHSASHTHGRPHVEKAKISNAWC